jgi:hypothetical protein
LLALDAVDLVVTDAGSLADVYVKAMAAPVSAWSGPAPG